MTDLEKMKNTFTELGVEFKEKTAKEEYNEDITTSSYDGDATWDICLKLDNGIGYYSFECDFYFLDGKYLTHGVWE